MKFKENHKNALAKVLSDLVQSDGIVNQGEIDCLNHVNKMLYITSANRQKATNLTLSQAIGMLRSLGNLEKMAVLKIVQYLSVSDDTLDHNESLLITALLLAIGINLPKTEGIKASLVTIPTLNFDTRNAVLYVESKYDENINQQIENQYDAICQLLHSTQRDFFYLPKVMRDIQDKKATFRNTLGYIEPTLSEEQLDIIDRDLGLLDSAALSKEIFLNYLDINGFNLKRPSFFFKINNARPSAHQDFLILEIDDNPFATLQKIYDIEANIANLVPQGLNERELHALKKLEPKEAVGAKDELQYTGFHKTIIDTLLKYNGNHGISRLFVTTNGSLYLTDRNNTEVKMPALSKALYILFLLHEDGISLNYLSEYKSEIYRIYKQISTYNDDDLLRQAVENLTDFIGTTMNANLSRIKKAFVSILGDEATLYLIQGDKGEKKTINLDRRFVVFEDRDLFI